MESERDRIRSAGERYERERERESSSNNGSQGLVLQVEPETQLVTKVALLPQVDAAFTM